MSPNHESELYNELEELLVDGNCNDNNDSNGDEGDNYGSIGEEYNDLEELLVDPSDNYDSNGDEDDNYGSNGEEYNELDKLLVDGNHNYDSNGDEYGDRDLDGVGVGVGDGDADHNEEGDSDDGLDGDVDEGLQDGITVDGLADIIKIDMTDIATEDVGKYDFGDLEAAYLFYSWYARVNGFAPRKDKLLRNKKGEPIQQTFVCSRAGFRDDRGVPEHRRRRQAKNQTRCGCEAKFRVHIDIHSSRWYVSVFNDEHNHELLPEKFCIMLPAHRKMTPADILLVESFLRAGISPPQIYGAFAYKCGGHQKIGFRLKDLYNQIARQKRKRASDASCALKYLRSLISNDPLMYVRHTIDDEGRLQNLFWSDGESQMNYQIFGDVIAFDATYKKNKYKLPFVVFSGVNHHNQTIVFATALVANEKEETYVWLLEQLLQVMHDKAPSSVITDGDLSMKSAIKKVLPCAHHRLCAWHLLRNANSHVGIKEVIPYLKKCMMGDYDVPKFEEIWNEMITQFGLEDNDWMKELYDRRKMWATSYIRGNFFAGLRTTSRCEALHSHLGKYLHQKINLTDFVQQFHRCLTYFRFREVEADFQSQYGDVVLQTSLRSIEKSASRQFTKEIFTLFREVLRKVSLVRVVDSQEMSMQSIYAVSKYRGGGELWNVSYCPDPMEFRCSCLRMESMGLPCEHIIVVMLSLDFNELPKCLVLHRWSKGAKDGVSGTYTDGSFYWDSHLLARYAYSLHLSKELCELSSREDDDYNHIVNVLIHELNNLKRKYGIEGGLDDCETQTMDDTIQDPVCVSYKGCGQGGRTAPRRVRRNHRCSNCGQVGHNRRSCPNGRCNDEDLDATDNVDDSFVAEYDEDINSEMCNQEPETFIPSCSDAYDYE